MIPHKVITRFGYAKFYLYNIFFLSRMAYRNADISPEYLSYRLECSDDNVNEFIERLNVIPHHVEYQLIILLHTYGIISVFDDYKLITYIKKGITHILY